MTAVRHGPDNEHTPRHRRPEDDGGEKRAVCEYPSPTDVKACGSVREVRPVQLLEERKEGIKSLDA